MKTNWQEHKKGTRRGEHQGSSPLVKGLHLAQHVGWTSPGGSRCLSSDLEYSAARQRRHERAEDGEQRERLALRAEDGEQLT
jgi:hypothetical protein